ncbi:MAG: ADP-ribosylglycohydrolase family protein [Pseudomonadales bacterium]
MSDPGLRARIRGAWVGRVSGCMLGKPVERLSMLRGHEALTSYLAGAQALPLRDYVPFFQAHEHVRIIERSCCRENLSRAEPDDDINYTVLSLLLLEAHGADLTTIEVARMWLNRLSLGMTFTAERAAYRILAAKGDEWFAQRGDPGFDLAECSDNPYNDWIGAQIRTDLYGWVCPGRPELAADLARRDAELSHRGDGVHGARFVAALGAAIPAVASLDLAVQQALELIPESSGAASAVRLGIGLAGDAAGGEAIRNEYLDMSPVHTLNNLALVVWSLLSHPDDFSAAIGDAVAAGLDTDCNGATVGGLWGMQGKSIPVQWSAPWQGRVGVSLAGLGELQLDDLVERTLEVAANLAN